MPTFAATEKGYANLWAQAKITPAKHAAAEKVARRIIANRARYEAVEKKTGVPWAWIGAVHDREAGGLFTGVLHNGERIIGTGRKTRLVPAGRGPFSTWEVAAVDALQIKKLHQITDWSFARMLFEAERFNGTGYFGRGVNSPYLWAATSLQQGGKYVSDHKWSSTAWDEQLGVVAVMKALLEIDPGVFKKADPPAAPIVVASTVGSAVIVGASVSGNFEFMVGAALAAGAVLAIEYLRTEKGQTMLKSIFTNWKTTAAGGSSVLLAIADILRQVATKQFDPALLYADGMAILIGTGLITAKDSNVTGGTKTQ